MSSTTVKTFVRVGDLREPCTIVIQAGSDNALREAEMVLRTMLNAHRAFLEEAGGVITGRLLREVLVEEKIARDAAHAMKMIVHGSVLRRDESDGQWKIVATKEATMRPGWWKIFKYGQFLVGEDGRVEKRLNAKSGFRKLPASSRALVG